MAVSGLSGLSGLSGIFGSGWPITITAATSTKVYDGTTTSSETPTITGGSLLAGDTAAFTEAYDSRNVFSPVEVGTLIRWYRSDGLIFQNAGGTIPCTDATEIAQWNDTSGQAKNLTQASGDTRNPIFTSKTLGILFDGVNDFLNNNTNLSNTVGTVAIAFATGATAFATQGDQVLVSQGTTSNALNWLEFGINAAGRMYLEFNLAGVKYRATCSTVLDVSTSYTCSFSFDGVAYRSQVNGIEQVFTVTGLGLPGWFGNVVVSGNNKFCLGGTRTNATEVTKPFDGSIYQAAVYSDVLGTVQLSKLRSYFETKYTI